MWKTVMSKIIITIIMKKGKEKWLKEQNCSICKASKHLEKKKRKLQTTQNQSGRNLIKEINTWVVFSTLNSSWNRQERN